MIKVSAKVAFLLVVVTVFLSSSAYASSFLDSFRLRIEDTVTGAGIVLTSTNTTLNSTGGADTIFTNQTFEGITTQVTAAYTEATGILTLSAQVSNNTASPGQIRITLEDRDYAAYVPPAATFTGSVLGAPDPNNFDPFSPTALAQLTGGASTSFQAWINTANAAPDFGADGIYTTGLTPATVVIPAGSLYTFPGGDPGKTYTAPAFADSYSGDVNLASSYAIASQATITFVSGGSAGFTLQGSVTPGSTGTPLSSNSVPEPTSLLLLGSGLVGLGGMLRRKYGQAV